MKRMFAFIMATAFAFTLAACTDNSVIDTPESNTPLPSETVSPEERTQSMPSDTTAYFVERLGFAGGNIGAGGLVCGGDDGYIYYRSESDGWKLYRAKPDGSEKIKVSDRIASCINVLDGWVYFLDYPENFPIYKVRTDGTEEIKLVDGYCGNLYVAESGIYFDKRDEKNISHVYRADLDGGNASLLFADASLMYYYKGKIYLGAGQLGVYDIETGEEKLLTETSVYNVSVDDSGIYYWAVDNGEFRHMDLDGGHDSVILHGGDFFNYADGSLYYMGISENASGPCHVINRRNVETGKTTTLYEELNEFFDGHGDLLGVTYRQFNDGNYNTDIFDYNEQGEYVLKGGGDYYNEAVNYVYIVGEYFFMRAALRESIVQKGGFDCIARLDEGLIIWD